MGKPVVSELTVVLRQSGWKSGLSVCVPVRFEGMNIFHMLCVSLSLGLILAVPHEVALQPRTADFCTLRTTEFFQSIIISEYLEVLI